MKKIYLCLIGLFFITNSFAMNNSFFVDNTNKNVLTIKEAKKLRDESPVVLEGYIVQQIDDDEFTFRDTTGQEIKIDIDDKVMFQFSNARITPNTLIRIHGALDKEFFKRTKIDVFQLEILRD